MIWPRPVARHLCGPNFGRCAYHAYEDRGPTQVFHGYHIGYNAEAAEGTIKAVININTLKDKEAKQ
jgi:hypothetical protein